MWQIASPVAQKKKKKKKLPKYHFKRTMVQLKLDGALGANKIIAPARLLLNEFKEDRISLFSSARFETGDMISVTFQEPRRFFCKAKVISCQEVPRESKVITAERYDYRLVMDLKFASETDRAEVKSFLDLINEQFLETDAAKVEKGKRAAVQSEEEDMSVDPLTGEPMAA